MSYNRSSTSTASSARDGATDTSVALRDLISDMRDEIKELRAGQSAAEKEIRDLQIAKAAMMGELMDEIERTKRMRKKLKAMELQQQVMSKRIFTTRKVRFTTQRAGRSSEPTQPTGSQSDSTPVPEPLTPARDLRREAAFVDIRDFDLHGAPDVYGREGPPPSNEARGLRREGAFEDIRDFGVHAPPNVYGREGPAPSIWSQPAARGLKREAAFASLRDFRAFDQYGPPEVYGREGPPPSREPRPTPHPRPRFEYSDSDSDDEDLDEAAHNSTGNSNGKKRSRDDSDSEEPSTPEPALPFAKRRKAMNGGLVLDEPLSRRPSAHSMEPPSAVAVPSGSDTAGASHRRRVRFGALAAFLF